MYIALKVQLAELLHRVSYEESIGGPSSFLLLPLRRKEITGDYHLL